MKFLLLSIRNTLGSQRYPKVGRLKSLEFLAATKKRRFITPQRNDAKMKPRRKDDDMMRNFYGEEEESQSVYQSVFAHRPSQYNASRGPTSPFDRFDEQFDRNDYSDVDMHSQAHQFENRFVTPRTPGNNTEPTMERSDINENFHNNSRFDDERTTMSNEYLQERANEHTYPSHNHNEPERTDFHGSFPNSSRVDEDRSYPYDYAPQQTPPNQQPAHQQFSNKYERTSLNTNNFEKEERTEDIELTDDTGDSGSELSDFSGDDASEDLECSPEERAEINAELEREEREGRGIYDETEEYNPLNDEAQRRFRGAEGINVM
jgi:hypothetical protein